MRGSRRRKEISKAEDDELTGTGATEFLALPKHTKPPIQKMVQGAAKKRVAEPKRYVTRRRHRQEL